MSAFLAFSLTLPTFAHVGKLVLLALGFGFVIFWHELGHFLAAKAVGIRVEQFAIGFGNAVFAWRKGVGLKLGNTQKAYRDKAVAVLESREKAGLPLDEKREYTDEQIESAATELGLGDTEYRLNWIPLGGYVKMLGQDDMKPDAQADDPRAYNKKSVGARMIVISAGVIMNVILAALGFLILFRIGFNVAPAWVGSLVANSPAQHAGLRPGDRILSFDGHVTEDFTKVTLDTALVEEGSPVPVVIDRPASLRSDNTKFTRLTLMVTPGRRDADPAFLVTGFKNPVLLKGVTPEEAPPEELNKLSDLFPPGFLALHPGDVLTAVNGTPVTPQDFALFDQIVQNAGGKPITLTIKDSAGQTRTVENNVHFAESFNGVSPIASIAGMVPRLQVSSFSETSAARGPDKLHFGDVIVSIKTIDLLPHPTMEQLIDALDAAGNSDRSIDVTVLRDGKIETVHGLKATVKIKTDHNSQRYGLGVALGPDEKQTVIAGLSDASPAKAAGLIPGDRIVAVNGKSVKNWFDVQHALAAIKPNAAGALQAAVSYQRENVTEPREATLSLSPEQLASVQGMRYVSDIQEGGLMAEYDVARKTDSTLTAAKWGISETRDFILQFYLTLRRMTVERSVSPSNMMGPVGIFIGGAHFAYKGYDWLLWFLCLISANLAVVNFLPIPVVDGGQFMFLIFEKIKGKPLSTRSMVIAQYIGLAFLAAVVLFVTYHDILRAI